MLPGFDSLISFGSKICGNEDIEMKPMANETLLLKDFENALHDGATIILHWDIDHQSICEIQDFKIYTGWEQN